MHGTAKAIEDRRDGFSMDQYFPKEAGPDDPSPFTVRADGEDSPLWGLAKLPDWVRKASSKSVEVSATRGWGR